MRPLEFLDKGMLIVVLQDMDHDTITILFTVGGIVWFLLIIFAHGSMDRAEFRNPDNHMRHGAEGRNSHTHCDLCYKNTNDYTCRWEEENRTGNWTYSEYRDTPRKIT